MLGNPQLEDGYTKIANEILEALAKINLSPYETRMILIIWRKTYGHNKKEDYMSWSQLTELSRIQPSHISRTIKRLIQRRIVTRIGNKLGFNKYYKDYRELPKLVTTVTNTGNKNPAKQDKGFPKLPKLVTKKRVTSRGMPVEADTKETSQSLKYLKKENIKKEKPEALLSKSKEFQTTWQQYLEMRVKIRKPATLRAKELILAKLAGLSPDEDIQIKILEQSIENSWQGVFALKTVPGVKGRKYADAGH